MLEPSSIEKVARLRAALPFLTEGEAAARWGALSEQEKVAFTALLQAARPVLSQIGGAIAKVPGVATAKRAVGLGMGAMTAAGAAGAFGQGVNAKTGSALAGAPSGSGPTAKSPLTKRALAMGLHDAIDLGAYGLLAAGPVAEVVSPAWAEHHHAALAGADLAGLGLLARHHLPIPGIKPAGH